MAPLSIVFMGTANLACPSLEALTQSPDFRVLAVVTQPDKPKGRQLKLLPSPVKLIAQEKPLPLLQPEKARHEPFIAELNQLKPDLIVVAAYGQILPRQVLELPRFGCLNVHTSLLPKYRGAAPIQWAILNDEPETGVTIMKMDEGLDTGDILAAESTPINPDDNSQRLHDRLAAMGASLLVRTIPRYVAGGVAPRKQAGEVASYARKITKDDGRLDWNQPARALWSRVRAFIPWPGAFTYLPADPKPVLLKIWEAEIAASVTGPQGEVVAADKRGIVVGCGQQALRIVSLQREGGKRLTAEQFLTGHPIKAGDKLG